MMLMGSGADLQEGDEYDDVDFPQLLKDNVDAPVHLLVWNIKARRQRVVELVPRDNWGGAGLLGVTIKLDDYGGADERLVRVLEVVGTNDNHNDNASSPANLAGLIPGTDFLLGTTTTTLGSTELLAALLHQHLNKVLELYVYNSTTDVVRVVGLHPTYRWGSNGGVSDSLLGAAVGTGYLHRLPESCRTTIGSSVERRVSIQHHASSSRSSTSTSNGIGSTSTSIGIGVGVGIGISENGTATAIATTEGIRIEVEPTLEMEVEETRDGGTSQHLQPHQLGTRPNQQQRSVLEVDTDSILSVSLNSTSNTNCSSSDSATEDDYLLSTPSQQQQQQQQQNLCASAESRPDPPSSAERAATALATSTAAAAGTAQQAQALLTLALTSTSTSTSTNDNSSTEQQQQYLRPDYLRHRSAYNGSDEVGGTPVNDAARQPAAVVVPAVPVPVPPPPPPAQTKNPFPPPLPRLPAGVAVGSPPVPPPPPMLAAADPPPSSANNNVDDDDGNYDEQYHDDDDDGSEYTDDEGDYTDDENEEGETPSSQKAGGFFSKFMPAPPKMEY